MLFVGYQAEGTLGRKIHDGAESVRLFGDEIAVNCEVTELIGVSGHADKEGLLNRLKGFKKKPQLIFVNHGDDEAVRDFSDAVEQEIGVKAFAPFSGTSYDLIKGEFIEITEGVLKVNIVGYLADGDSRVNFDIAPFRSTNQVEGENASKGDIALRR